VSIALSFHAQCDSAERDAIRFLRVIRNNALVGRSNAGHLQSSCNCHTANTVARRFDSIAEVRLRFDRTGTH
jgi:hypothetical protein